MAAATLYYVTCIMFLCFQTVYDACRFVPMVSSIAHKMVPRSCFVRVLDYAQILGVRTFARLGRSPSKLCSICCRLRTKLCPNFGRSRVRLCLIYFATCPFPNLAGTLQSATYHNHWRITIGTTGIWSPMFQGSPNFQAS